MSFWHRQLHNLVQVEPEELMSLPHNAAPLKVLTLLDHAWHYVSPALLFIGTLVGLVKSLAVWRSRRKDAVTGPSELLRDTHADVGRTLDELEQAIDQVLAHLACSLINSDSPGIAEANQRNVRAGARIAYRDRKIAERILELETSAKLLDPYPKRRPDAAMLRKLGLNAEAFFAMFDQDLDASPDAGRVWKADADRCRATMTMWVSP
ncbi:MAG: hypothetical protein KGJ92_00200 [Actinomycetales bacterium]|nr:hypothetical protein [Actinomycetales bacterium]